MVAVDNDLNRDRPLRPRLRNLLVCPVHASRVAGGPSEGAFVENTNETTFLGLQQLDRVDKNHLLSR